MSFEKGSEAPDEEQEEDNQSSGSWNSDTREALFLDQKRYAVLFFSFLAMFANIMAENVVQAVRGNVSNLNSIYQEENKEEMKRMGAFYFSFFYYFYRITVVILYFPSAYAI